MPADAEHFFCSGGVVVVAVDRFLLFFCSFEANPVHGGIRLMFC